MRSIRWKLVLTSFVIVLLPVYLLSRYAIRSFDRFTSKALEEEMVGQALMLCEQYRAMILAPSSLSVDERAEELTRTLQRYGERVPSRLQVLSMTGKVLFDSDPDTLVGADFSGRPEIANAMTAGDYKAAWRLARDENRVYYYVPIVIFHAGEPAGISYVTRHTHEITSAIMQMKRDQQTATVLAVVLAAFISAVLAQTMTHRLRKLAASAREYAEGNTEVTPDVSGRDEIGELGMAVSHMAQEIEDRNRYNREFVSAVIHELKSPITAIKGASEILEEGAIEKEAARRKFLGNIRYEADRLARMVGELSQLTKVDAEVLRGQKQQVDYCGCVRAIVDRLMPTFDQQHAMLRVVVPEGPIHVMIMAGRIEQVISNLLENAFRYTPVDGSVEVCVRLGDDGTVVTAVKDSGPGIPEKAIEKVFDRFYTTERKDLAKDYGSGLGLAIARSIVENHQGRMWVESQEGDGACFLFSLSVV